MLSERVFLAFETGRGLAYVQASGWQRAYLLWTFRNFRGVPHKILNARQRKLVDALYPAASIDVRREIEDATVIGRVEDFILPFPAPVPVSAAAKKSVPVVPGKKLAGVLARSYKAQLHGFYARLAFSGLTRTFGAGALVAILVVLGWQQLPTRPVVSASTPVPGITSQPQVQDRADEDRAGKIAPAIVPSPKNIDSRPLPLSQTTEAAHIGFAPGPANSSSRPTPSQSPATLHPTEQASSKRGPIHRVIRARSNVAELAGLPDGSTAALRMKISGPPRKLVYPVCPDGSTRGKVSLQAVVGYDGTVSQVRLLVGNRLLAAAARRAIREWRYEPFSEDAPKLERETRITVSFISNDVVAVSFPDATQASR